MSTTTIASALFPKTRLLVLKELALNRDQPVHLRELARRTGLDPTGMGRELANLEHAGIVKVKVSGNQKIYSLETDCPIYNELRMIIIKTVGIADEIRFALDPIADKISVAFIYGSFASGTFNINSDIDLIIVGNVTLKQVIRALAKTGRKLARVINPSVLKTREYDEHVSNPDSFISSITSGPLIYIIGDKIGT